MKRDLPSERRLTLLSEQALRPWSSLEETRRCIGCDRVFSGREVRIMRLRSGVTKLHCPTRDCRLGPVHWVHPEEPLTSPEAWEDWSRLIDAAKDAESLDSAVA